MPTRPARPLASPALAAKIREFHDLNNQIDTLAEELSILKVRRKQVGENEITELVTEEEVQHSGVRLEDGREYTFERDVQCGILKDERSAAYAWLDAHRCGHLLKRHLVLTFGNDSAEAVEKVRTLLAQVLPEYEIGIKVGRAPTTLVDAVQEILTRAELTPTVSLTDKLELPGATLAAFVRKCLTAGITLPASFGVYAPLKPVPVNLPPVTTIVDDTSPQTEAVL